MDICPTKENQTQSDYSHLFEIIHPAFTVVQACISIIFIILPVSLNLLLSVAIVKFHHQMDEALILCVSIFITNVVLSLNLGINIFLSTPGQTQPNISIPTRILYCST